jgi:hypothetical protein
MEGVTTSDGHDARDLSTDNAQVYARRIKRLRRIRRTLMSIRASSPAPGRHERHSLSDVSDVFEQRSSHGKRKVRI